MALTSLITYERYSGEIKSILLIIILSANAICYMLSLVILSPLFSLKCCRMCFALITVIMPSSVVVEATSSSKKNV